MFVVGMRRADDALVFESLSMFQMYSKMRHPPTFGEIQAAKRFAEIQPAKRLASRLSGTRF